MALLSAAACAAETPVAGKWNCTNVSETGAQSRWTLAIRNDGGKLAGSLTDGEIELPLSEMKIDGNSLTFQFEINGKPYKFQGDVNGKKLEGKYSGEEASGKLQCEKVAT